VKKGFNYHLFFLIAFLSGFSLLFFACLSAPASLQRSGNTSYFFIHQLLFAFVPAVLAGFIAYKFPLPFLKKWAPLLVLLNVLALFLVFIPGIGLTAKGASRWINILGINFQPSEFLKITAILYLSAWVTSKLSGENIKGWWHSAQKAYHNFTFIFLPFVVFLGAIAIALYLQRDISTLGIISLTLLAVYFSAKTPFWHTLTIIFSGASILLFFIKFEPYRLDRWMIFLNPDSDPLGKGFQVKQSLISLGSGGIFGQGLGLSVQKFGFLPEAMTDSIFAIIGEELGLLGCILLLALFVALFWIGIKISKNSQDSFAKIVAIGIVFWIILQAFINILSAIGWFPLAGIPLPFFSSGGSHLVAEMIGIGLLLNISKNT